MKERSKVVVVLCIALALMFSIIAAYWWSNREPSKPKDVPQSAVFMWAPYDGIPGPRRGWWLHCDQKTTSFWCTVNQVDGTLKYQGEYIPYHIGTEIAATNLRIDAVKSRKFGVWIEHKNIPIIYMQNGEILIPASRYEEGKQILNSEGYGRDH